MSEMAKTGNSLALIEKAIERGVDAQQLEKLMDLHERWQQSQAKEAFNRAMNACQAQMPTVIKDATNQHTRSMYARLETLTAAITPVYTAHGFSLSFGEEDCPRPDWIRCVCTVRHSAGHVEVFRGDFPLDGIGSQGAKSSMNPVQAVGSTRSYARRYMACGVFNVTVAGEDTDAARETYLATPAQLLEIDELIEATGSDLAKLLAWGQVEELRGLSEAKAQDAINALRRKAKKAGATS